MGANRNTPYWEEKIDEQLKAEREAIAHMLESFLRYNKPSERWYEWEDQPRWLPPFMDELAQMIREGKHHESIWVAK